HFQSSDRLLVTFLDSDEGRRRLLEASPIRPATVEGFCKKLRCASCGMASISLVMRAQTGDQVTYAEDFIYDRLSDIKPLADLDQRGMTADDVAACLLRLGAASSVRRPGSADELRDLALTRLAQESSSIIANFHLKSLGFPSEWGHLSPVAAYHRDSDSLLIMDNDPKPNDPFWVTVQDLYESMRPADPESGLPRGLILAEF
uniref:glutathione gamma-glutamylcysteinyltransferase n=2 Tax=Macrostomum lignano TaxID=282301 RepID=A0A1I8J0D7_9PLAT